MKNENKKDARVHQKLNSDDLFFILKEKDRNDQGTAENREMFRCDCQGRYCDGFPVSMHPTLAAKIDALKNKLERPLQVISGIRCEQRNRETDGSEHSFHLLGRAADIQCESMNVDQLAEAAEAMGLLVIRDYQDNVVHCQWND